MFLSVGDIEVYILIHCVLVDYGVDVLSAACSFLWLHVLYMLSKVIKCTLPLRMKTRNKINLIGRPSFHYPQHLIDVF